MKNKTIIELIEHLRTIGAGSETVAVEESVSKACPETLSAFANGKGGTLIVGISKSDNFTVTKPINPAKEQSRLINACCKLTPVVKPTIDFVEFEDRTLLVAKVEGLTAKKKPCYITKTGMYGGSFTRLGDHDIRLDDEEVDQLVAGRKRRAWDEEAVKQASVEDLDPELLKPFLAERKAARKRTFLEGTQSALNHLGITSEGHPTLAALLTFGKYPQEFFPRLTVILTRFPSFTADPGVAAHLLDRATFEGTIPEMVTAAAARIAKDAQASSKGAIADNFGAPDYPPQVIAEVLTNALVHRDYSPPARNLPVRVNMFPDRLEITSPGSLHRANQADLGQDGFTSVRNERLCALLAALPGSDTAISVSGTGLGLPQVRAQLSSARMPAPDLRETVSSFTVVLHRMRLSPIENEPTALERVSEYLETKHSASTSAIVEALGLSRTSVQNSLNSLIKSGKVEALQPVRSPRQKYRLKNETSQ